MTKEEFVKLVASNQPEVPMYFPKSAAKNLEGSPALGDLPKPKEFSTNEIENFDGVVLDVRANATYGAGHIANAINIGLGGQFASWAGTMIPIGTPLVIAADTKEQVDEAFMRLARVGHESVSGFILMSNYEGEKKAVEQVSVEDVCCLIGQEIQLVDVRRVAEHINGHAPTALNLPLDKLAADVDRLDPKKPTYVICQSGYRSSVGTSILENAGFEKIYNVTGGTAAWISAGLPTEKAKAAV
jgi:hydroxyacylglutathione hydrolase